MKNARPESEIFSDMAALCATPGYIHALAYTCWRDNFITFEKEMTPEDMAKSYAPDRLIRTEASTLMGLLIKAPIDYSLPKPRVIQGFLDKTKELLEELHWSMMGPMIASFSTPRDGTPSSPFGQGAVLREPIFYGGESAYSFQYRDLAADRYARDDDWLKAHKGFVIAEAQAVARAIGRVQNKRLRATMKDLRTPLPDWTILPGFTFSVSDITKVSGLDAYRVVTILDAFSIGEEERNDRFQSLSDFNVANSNPLIKTPDGKYILLQSYSLVESLYDSPIYWMFADKEYRQAAMKHRGDFTEEFSASRLASVFGPESVYSNLDIVGPKRQKLGEIDVLVSFGNRAIVLQAKSKKMTLEARRGNDLQIRDDFKKAVQEAYDQGFKCATHLREQGAKLFGPNGQQVTLPTVPDDIYVLCVVSDHYPALTVQAGQFLEEKTAQGIHPALVTDVFFLDVLAEMLNSPLRFLSYIDRRVGYSNKLTSINELTILGYHLSKNLWLDDEYDQVMISDDVAIDLDTAMCVRREGLDGSPTPEGILTRLKETSVGKLLSLIEAQPEPALLDLGFMLLTLSEDTIREVSDGISRITSQTREDGQPHDVTVGLGEGDTGLTIHSNRNPNAKAAQSLLTHCVLRKYTQRAGSWFGLCLRPEDQTPRFAIYLKSPWQEDVKLDAATADMDLEGEKSLRPSKAHDAVQGRSRFSGLRQKLLLDASHPAIGVSNLSKNSA